MYQQILIPTDGSVLAQRGVDHGLALAKVHGAKVIFVVVSELLTGMTLAGEPATSVLANAAELRRASDAAAQKLLESARQLANARDVPCELVHMGDKVPAEAILEAADVQRCDLIVMSSHGWRGLERLLLGSQATEVVTRAKIPVLVVK